MEKIGSTGPARLLSSQTTDARTFFLRLDVTGSSRFAVALGGRETCRPDYAVHRQRFPYFGFEYVAEGAGVVVLGGTRHPLGPGSVFSYGPLTPCEIRTDPTQPLVKYFLCFGGRTARRRLVQAGLPPGSIAHLTAPAELRSLLEDLGREAGRPGVRAEAIATAWCDVLWLKLADALDHAAASPTAVLEPARATFERCKALIDTEAERLTSLADIARAAALEPSSVCRLFRRYQGTSPYQYLLRRKMTLAARFLIESGGLVKQAAQQVGFTDPYHFSRCFKAVHGVAPRHLVRRSARPTPGLLPSAQPTGPSARR